MNKKVSVRALVPSRRWRWIAGGCCAGVVFAALAVFLIWGDFGLFGEVEAWRVRVVDWLERVPKVLYLILFAILPLVGAPVSLFYFTAVPVLGGPRGLYGILGALLCIGVGVSLGYWLAAGILRPYIARWMHSLGYDAPAIRRENEWKVILAVRLSPLPYLVQNYSLGLTGCRFPLYLAISWVTQGLIGLGFILLGESFASGTFRYAIIGVFLIVLFFILTSYLRRYLNIDRNPPRSH